MELKKHIPFIVIVLAILGTWNATRLDLADLRIEFREEIRDLSKRVTALDERVTKLDESLTTLDERVTALDARVTALDTRISSLSERVARIEGILSGKVSNITQPQRPGGATAHAGAPKIPD